MNRYILLSLFFIAFIQGCYKEIIYEENPFLQRPKNLRFDKIEADAQVIYIGGTALLTAIATGDSLNYKWESNLGDLESIGKHAYFSSNDIGEAEIVCTVTDLHGNTSSKNSLILITTELTFHSLWATDTIIPNNFTTYIKAEAAGKQLVFDWGSDLGTIEFENNIATFQAIEPGNYNIWSKIRDIGGTEITKNIEIIVQDGFVYKKLEAERNYIKPGENIYIEAFVLENSEETFDYKWQTVPLANIFGYGNRVIFTICHADVFEVFCTVSSISGKNETKSITIYVGD